MTPRTFALAAALALVPASAFAGDRSVEVSYSDLDLSTREGMAQLDKRIDRAAKSVCTNHRMTTGSIRSTSVDEGCYEQARQNLRAQLAAVTGRKLEG